MPVRRRSGAGRAPVGRRSGAGSYDSNDQDDRLVRPRAIVAPGNNFKKFSFTHFLTVKIKTMD